MSPTSTIYLHQLPTHQWATVQQILPNAKGQHDAIMLRLLEIGFVPGESVKITAVGKPGNEPLAVRIGNTTFGLRRFEAERVCVLPGDKND